MNIILSDKIKRYWITDQNCHALKDIQVLQQMFLPFLINITQPSALYDIQLTNTHHLNPDHLNILLCVENCQAWSWYGHYNLFGDFGNPNIHLYIYNHHSKLLITPHYLVIPTVYLMINYFKLNLSSIQPSIVTPFDKKKFCFIANPPKDFEQKNGIYQKKKQLIEQLTTLGECHYIDQFKDRIGTASCYQSLELINLLNEYKFVFVCENSILDGYITEKIFNPFYARIIPLYYGAEDRNRYFNPESFIDLRGKWKMKHKKRKRHAIETKLKKLMNDEELYKNMIEKPKINPDFDDEDFIEKTETFIKNKFKN